MYVHTTGDGGGGGSVKLEYFECQYEAPSGYFTVHIQPQTLLFNAWWFFPASVCMVPCDERIQEE